MTVDVALDSDRLEKRYRRGPALRFPPLSVRRGERVAIVGENGAGKSTLLRLLAGLLEPDAGTVRRHGRAGYCPQRAGLLDLLTPVEHLRLFGAGSGLGPAEAIEQSRSLLDALSFPGGRDVPVRSLSGGTQQKLNLALALLGDPTVLLLDEPYQGFDMGSYLDFWDLVDGWSASGTAVVVVTHLLAELHRVDTVIELHAPDGATA